MTRSTAPQAGKAQLVLGTLFGGVFAAVGLGVLFFLVVPTLLDAAAARSWVPAQARVESTDLVRSRGSKSVSYRVAAHYRYVVDGQEHQGERVGLIDASDNIGDWHERWHRRLLRAIESGEPIAAYVDPADPTRSILDRKPRWGLIGLLLLFPLAFGGGGIGLIVFFVRGYRKGTRQGAGLRRHAAAGGKGSRRPRV